MKKKHRVFLLDDDELIITVLSKSLRKEGYETYVETSTDDVISKISAWGPDVVLMDISMPERSGIEILEEIVDEGIDTEVIMLSADDAVETVVNAMKIGATDYITKPFDSDKVKITIKNIIEKKDLKQEVQYLRKAYSESVHREIIGNSSAFKNLMGKIEKLAEARVSAILITGESGTGKEVIARHIHNLMFGLEHSERGPFISVNCAAMPESLLESELFGYEKGAFTDAKSHKMGLFEQAKGGTLLLDEIGEMKKELQSKLLRVLEERKVRRISGSTEIYVDVTVIATTVQNDEFRPDLFFRLSNFYLHVVPLKERKEDIPLLARHFLKYFSVKYNKKDIEGFSSEAEKLLMDYHWPGNVRELKNLVERFVVLENTVKIRPEHLPLWISSGSGTQPAEKSFQKRFILPESGISLDALEKDLIIQSLERANDNMTVAARLLGVTYDSFRYQLKKFGIK
jgi:DNA-binding NtrC family response regulator